MTFFYRKAGTPHPQSMLAVQSCFAALLAVLCCGGIRQLQAQPVSTPATAVTAPRKPAPTDEPLPLFQQKETRRIMPKLFYSAALSSDDRWLAGGVGDWTTEGEIFCWDVTKQKQVFRHTLGRGIRSLAFSPDGKLLAAGSFTNEILIVAVPSAAIVARWIPHTGAVNGLAFSPDGKLLASGSLDKTVKLWDINPPADPALGMPLRATFDGHADLVYSVAFSHDGKTLYSAGRETKVFVWDVENNVPQAVWKDLPASVESIAVSRDGGTVALGMWDGSVELRKAETGEVTSKLEHLPSGDYTVGVVSFGKDGKSLVSSATDGTAKIWDFPAATLRTSIKGHIGRAWAYLSADASQLFTAGSDGHVRVWDAKTKKRLHQFPDNLALTETTNPITAVAWHTDPAWMLMAHVDRSVRLRDTATGQTRQMVVAPSEMAALAVSPDGLHAIGAGKDQTAYLFDLKPTESKTLASPIALKGPPTELTCVLFSADGRQAYSAGQDGIIQQWDVTSKEAGRTWTTDKIGIQILARSTDGKWLAAGDIQGSIHLWDITRDNAQPVAVLKGHKGAVMGLAFASQAPLLASGGADLKALVWNLSSLRTDKSPDKSSGAGSEIQPIKLIGHSDSVTSLVLSPQGTWLATGGDDRTVRIWDVRTGKLWKVMPNSESCRGLRLTANSLMVVRTDKFLDVWPLQKGLTISKVAGRYVKLRALSACQVGDPYASAAEIDLFQAAQPIAKTDWKIYSVDSDDVGNEARLAIDGNPATFWHTQWQTSSPKPPHELVIDLGQRYTITGLFVQSRTDDSHNGTIRNFEFFIGDDPQKFGKPVLSGELNPAIIPKR